MPTSLKSTGKLGTEKHDLKRVEIYITNETYDVLSKAAKQYPANPSTKKFMEMILNTKAFNLKK